MENVLSHERVQSVGRLDRFDAVRLFAVGSMVYANKPATIDELHTNIEKLGSVSGILQACPWWPCKRNRVSFIMASNSYNIILARTPEIGQDVERILSCGARKQKQT